MSHKADLLNAIKSHIRTRYEMPEIAINGITYPDKTAQFKEILKAVGGEAIELKAGEEINDVIRSYFPNAKNIASNLPEIRLATINPDEVSTPQELAEIDLGIVQGEVGVAENGCVWVPQLIKERVVFFISEYLVILLDKDALVNNMHEAYERINFHDSPYGVFISGPSKTADIEQALVVGAHGPKGLLVLLR